jgi:hypothetical protein
MTTQPLTSAPPRPLVSPFPVIVRARPLIVTVIIAAAAELLTRRRQQRLQAAPLVLEIRAAAGEQLPGSWLEGEGHLGSGQIQVHPFRPGEGCEFKEW